MRTIAHKPQCEECGLRANTLIEYATGKHVCKACWEDFNYADFFWPKGKEGALDGQ